MGKWEKRMQLFQLCVLGLNYCQEWGLRCDEKTLYKNQFQEKI